MDQVLEAYTPVLEKIVIPKKKKFRYCIASKSGSIKINEESTIPVTINEYNSELLPIQFDEVLYEIQKNYMRLDDQKKIYQDLEKQVIEGLTPKPILKQSAALEGLHQLLYQHTNDVLEDLEAYEKPKFNGKIKHDIIINKDRKLFEDERIGFYGNKFLKLFQKYISLGKSEDDFKAHTTLVKTINKQNTPLQLKLNALYDLVIIAKENLPNTIKFVNEEVEEPIFDNPNEVTE